MFKEDSDFDSSKRFHCIHCSVVSASLTITVISVICGQNIKPTKVQREVQALQETNSRIIIIIYYDLHRTVFS